MYAVIPISVPFLGCVRLSGHVSRPLFFSLFPMWILICWCEENTGRHFKGFYLSKILGMQNNKHRGDRMLNTDRHKILRIRVATKY